jgi:hypothetical protein
MKAFEEQQNKYIDELYGESGKETKPSNQQIEFNEKFERVSEKLDILNEDIYNFDIDTIGIIGAVDRIKDGRKFKREFVRFLGTAVPILGLYGFLGLRYGYRVILISQIIIMAVIPWIIVPIAIKRRGGSEI